MKLGTNRCILSITCRKHCSRRVCAWPATKTYHKAIWACQLPGCQVQHLQSRMENCLETADFSKGEVGRRLNHCREGSLSLPLPGLSWSWGVSAGLGWWEGMHRSWIVFSPLDSWCILTIGEVWCYTTVGDSDLGMMQRRWSGESLTVQTPCEGDLHEGTTQWDLIPRKILCQLVVDTPWPEIDEHRDPL